MPEKTEREQHLRNEVGQLTHTVQRMIQQRAEMHSDLSWHRQDIKDALEMLERGMVRDAIEVLRDSLDRRERTREKRKSN